MSFFSSLSSSPSGKISKVDLNGLQKIEHLTIKKFYFSQRMIEDYKILNVRHAFLVLELENESLITAEVTGTSFQDIFVSFRSGGNITSTAFSPASTSLQLKDIIYFGLMWSQGEYNLAIRNCYHFVHGVLEKFAAGDVEIILRKLQDEWTCKIKGISSLATLAVGVVTGNSEMAKDGATGYISGLVARRTYE